MGPHITFVVVLGGLGHAFAGLEFRQHKGQNARVLQILKSHRCAARHDDFIEFVTHTFPTDFVGQRRVFFNRGISVRMVAKTQRVFKTDGSQDAQMVFQNALVRVANKANEFVAYVVAASHKIQHLLGERIVKKSVDSEVAAQRIVRGVGENHGVGTTPITGAGVAAESRHFKRVTVFVHVNDPEGFAHGVSVREKFFNLLRQSAGGNVVVFGLAVHQHVAHATARPVGLMAGVLKSAHNVDGGFLHGVVDIVAKLCYSFSMKILAIETSCDETSVSLVEDGRKVLSNVIASQISKHAPNGGVVPEVAAREHISAMIPVLREALSEAGLTWDEVDAIAVTKEPGLVGSLVVGRMTASALAFALNKPLIEVNHVHGHMYSSWLGESAAPEFPVLILTVSGGHNELVLMRGHGQFEMVAETLDDSAGEAFDKIARLLGLGYPGGPAIEERAKLGNPAAVKFPVALRGEKNFSFSGLKTSVFYYLKENEARLSDEHFVNDTAAAFQEAVVNALVEKLMLAVEEYAPREVHLTGGVSANRFLRGRIEEELSRLRDAPLFRSPVKIEYCTDNAAMIGAAAFFDKMA